MERWAHAFLRHGIHSRRASSSWGPQCYRANKVSIQVLKDHRMILTGTSGGMMAIGTIGFPGGCFFFRISLTMSHPFRSTWLSICKIPLLLWLETWHSVALTLPSIISLTNVRAVCASVFYMFLEKRPCMARPSRARLLMSPSLHSFSCQSRHWMWSFALDDAEGFCKSSADCTIAAFKAPASEYARRRRAISVAIALLAFPEGTLKRFLRQWTMSS